VGYLTKPLDQRKLFDMIAAAVPGTHEDIPETAATFASM
jgi:hypothetical protein